MKHLVFLLLIVQPFIGHSQKLDSIIKARTNFHFQLTTVTQHKAPFSAPYTGTNSLTTNKEMQTTLTATIFWGMRLWKGAAVYVNPEIAGGSGISSAHGIADFTNGEAFRVGDPAPKMYAARAYFRQIFNLGGEEDILTEGANQIYKSRSKQYFSVVLGKFSIADFFDNNTYSHDPRTQFFNWGLMSNGAWDYPANVRGYTWGGVLEYGTPDFKIRAASVMVPQEANGNIMDKHFEKANSNVVELEFPFTLAKQNTTVRLLAFYTQAHMGNYNLAVAENPVDPDITTTRKYGRTKYGFGFNMEQALSENSGFFIRGSWNDGKNETWAFTEIDRSLSIGFSTQGNLWKRSQDVLGIGSVLSGLSSYHQHYLAAGGYGFIIGDGALNYARESVTEIYYRLNIFDPAFYITPNYQFVINPAYNKDRGPASVFGLRAHIEF
jgi:high affinity Mn2+ porin